MTRVGWAGAVSAALLLAACSGSSEGSKAGSSEGSSTAPAASDTLVIPPPLAMVIDHADAPRTDTIEVFVCAVPTPTADPIYGEMTLRLDLDPAAIVTAVSPGVFEYFSTLSNGLYTPTFTVGTTVPMSATETHDDCVDSALAASSPVATTVMVVADAEHLASQPGGWGRPGAACSDAPCPAAVTGRALYVGASDFYDIQSGGKPLLDLVEHEIGHTLDLPHSGDPGLPHASALDVMSDSAAARSVRPDRLDAQGTLGVNLLALGWLPESSVSVAAAVGGDFELHPSNVDAGPAVGTRLLVLPLDDERFLTVEYLAAVGLDDFLDIGGVAVHMVDVSDGVGIDRRQTTLGSEAPHLRLLQSAGEVWTVEGWSVRLTADITADSDAATDDDSNGNGIAAQVEVHPTDR